MRPIEILLLLTNLLTLSLLAFPLPRAIRWMGHTPPITLLIAIVQVVVEGPRWQMAPAYALTGMFFLVWLRRIFTRAGGPAGRKRTKRLAASVTIGLGVLGLVISIILPAVLPVFSFPHPSGSYAIGTLTYHWIDADRWEVFNPAQNSRRELMVQIWYPAIGTSSSPRAPYVQDADALPAAQAQLHNLPEFILGTECNGTP